MTDKNFENSNHKHFTQIPNIIFELELTPYEIAVYCAIKRFSGENGICTKSYEKLAKNCGMSRRMLINTIQDLCEINPILKKPLIFSRKRLTEHGDSDTNILTINDIWKENHSFFNIEGGSAQYAPPSVQYASGSAQYTPGVVHNMHQGGAQYAPKEEHIKKNIYKKTNTNDLSQTEKRLIIADRLTSFSSSFSSLEKEEKEVFEVIKDYALKRKIVLQDLDICNWLKEYGKDLVSETFGEMIKSKELKTNPGGWMQDVLMKKHNFNLNKQFVIKFKEEKKWDALTITKQYCRDENSQNDYQFNLSHEKFKEEVQRKYETYAGSFV